MNKKLSLFTSHVYENIVRYTMISIVVVWLSVFTLLPQLGVVIVAFLTPSSDSLFSLPFSFNAFLHLFDPIFFKILWDSIELASTSTFLCLLIGYPFAYGIATAKATRRPMLLLLVIIPFWTNSVIRVYALILFLKKDGVISGFAEFFGFISEPISLMYGNIAIFSGFIYTLLPFMVLPIYVSVEKLDKRLYDAARDLGASPIKTFLYIIIPLTMPGILAGCMLVFLPTLTYFFIPEILGGARTVLIGNFIKNQFLVTRDWPLGAMASTVLTLMLFFFIILYKRVQKAVASEGMQELE